MTLLDRALPHRSHVAPLLATLFPLLWFVLRDATAPATGSLDATNVALAPGRYAGYVLGSLSLSYVVAVVVVAAVTGRDSGVWSGRVARLVFCPSNRTLSVLGVILAGIAAYFSARLLAPIPSVVDALLTPVGLVLGAPLVVAVAVLVAVGNLFPPAQSLAVRSVGIAVALAVTALWVLLVATWVGRSLDWVLNRYGFGGGPS
ncbi:MAG: hypothetical protein ACQETI_04975 [Halobacteriota archaeon]